MSSPTQRTKELLKKHGYDAAITERWNAFAKVRQDLFGFIDLIALKEGKPVLAVQTTSASNHADRRNKILASNLALTWLSTGAQIILISWVKRPKNLTRKRDKWEHRLEEITIDDFCSITEKEKKHARYDGPEYSSSQRSDATDAAGLEGADPEDGRGGSGNSGYWLELEAGCPGVRSETRPLEKSSDDASMASLPAGSISGCAGSNEPRA